MLNTHIINNTLIEEIDNLLPQTQCTRCGYPSCKDYARAIACDDIPINQCPPGKDDGIRKLAQLLNKPVIPLNTTHGEIINKQLAIIDEDACIGCTLCIKACPIDAIIGSNKMMHYVIASECTGCDLCIPVCPVDCISTIDDPNQDWNLMRKELAKNRYNSRNHRILQEKLEREEKLNALKISDINF